MDPAALNFQMPVVRVQPLNLEESVAQANTLENAFGMTVTLPISDGRPLVSVAFSEGGKLEMDVTTGLFLHTDKNNLWLTGSELS
ncbi:MAG: hypothetical protein NZ553_03835 [Caldilinea sp.]|nr:hypothetical protein [Caldilinea sp.]MDW8439583.1 hypothetical protein [Caldilineaceae bacterium]